MEYGGVKIVKLKAGDHKVRKFLWGETRNNSNMSLLMYELRDLQVQATREALRCDQGWSNQEANSRDRQTKDKQAWIRECERFGDATADREVPAFSICERTVGAVRCRVPRAFPKTVAYVEPTTEVLHWLTMRIISFELMSKAEKGEDRGNNPMKGVYHHPVKRRWYARHPTTKKYRYSDSVETTIKWATRETIDLEAEDNSEADKLELNQDMQEVSDVDDSEDVD